MSKWRELGLTYINYSNVAARVLRGALKPDLQADAAKRAGSNVKFTKWTDGKPAIYHLGRHEWQRCLEGIGATS
ncbi:Protein stunted [Pseudolycoriella hygida]|uniref:Protein stunted n=1 Tax=Pseudolycoriella hygida TaxID=35572 RepID=A0A9Q0MVH8_9DIPT|nr:Protein stunted [Pseudolycoriella hygida]